MRHIICADQLENTVLEPRGIVDMILGWHALIEMRMVPLTSIGM